MMFMKLWITVSYWWGVSEYTFGIKILSVWGFIVAKVEKKNIALQLFNFRFNHVTMEWIVWKIKTFWCKQWCLKKRLLP